MTLNSYKGIKLIFSVCVAEFRVSHKNMSELAAEIQDGVVFPLRIGSRSSSGDYTLRSQCPVCS